MATTRTRKRTTPAKKTAAKKTVAKKAAASPVTVVNLYKPPPVRRKLFTGPMGAHEQAAIRAALAAASLRLPIPVRTWNGSQAHLTDGLLLIHNPGDDRTFTAHIACRHGAIHGYPITSHTDLREARALTHACERPHTTTDNTDLDWDHAINHGVAPTRTPNTGIVVQLREGIRRAAHTLHDDTKPLNLTDITAGLAERATADDDQAKEHPEP
jgi:hypothetical protein